MTRILVAVAMVMGLAGPVRAVGIKQTAKLTVSGPRLPRTIEITDPLAIAANVFGGNFMTSSRTRRGRVTRCLST